MRTTSRIAVAFLAFIGTSSAAIAGGLGLTYHSGMHEERAYYYKGRAQALDAQWKPNHGPGLEAILGDKDDKIQGVLRMSWVMETPASNPDSPDAKGATFADYDSVDTRKLGVLGLGVQWGILGDPSDKQLTLNTLIGSGFITTDNTEYVTIELGAGGTYNFTEAIQGVVNLNGVMRSRKHISFGPAAHLGVRYLFD